MDMIAYMMGKKAGGGGGWGSGPYPIILTAQYRDGADYPYYSPIVSGQKSWQANEGDTVFLPGSEATDFLSALKIWTLDNWIEKKLDSSSTKAPFYSTNAPGDESFTMPSSPVVIETVATI